jgi:cardiolipin synthase C
VLTNSLAATDNYEAFSAYQKDRKEILATGIEIYEFKPHPQVRFKVMSAEVQAAMNYSSSLGMHSKTMIVDGRITVIGSFNLDPRSADLNTECIAIIRSPEVTANVAKYVEEEFLPENAWRTTPDYNPDKEAGPVKNTKVLPRKLIPKRVL